MTFLSFCAGIGGIDLGLQRAGLECIGQVEIDEHCHLILNRHFPGQRKGNDVTTYEHCGPRPDVICGGFPCQDLSVAGKREGLGGKRSGLFFTILGHVERLKPRFVLLENVPGLLSSWGPTEPAPGEIPDEGWIVEESSDFETVLLGLSELGYCVATGVLDSQYFGVPQRRDRVFIVASLGNGSAAEILFEPESVCGHPAPSRETGEGFAGALTSGLGERGCSAESAAVGHYVAGTLDTKSCAAHRGCQPNESEFLVGFVPVVSKTLTAEGADASPDGEGRRFQIVAPPVTAKWAKSSGGPSGDECQNVVVTSLTTRPHADNDGQEDKLVLTNGIAYNIGAFYSEGMLSENPNSGFSETETSRALQTNGMSPACNQGGTAVVQRFGVRRLTPRECERLQGFPDDWTAWGLDDDGKRMEISDSARYRMLGNAVTTFPAEWLGRQLMKAGAC